MGGREAWKKVERSVGEGGVKEAAKEPAKRAGRVVVWVIVIDLRVSWGVRVLVGFIVHLSWAVLVRPLCLLSALASSAAARRR